MGVGQLMMFQTSLICWVKIQASRLQVKQHGSGDAQDTSVVSCICRDHLAGMLTAQSRQQQCTQSSCACSAEDMVPVGQELTWAPGNRISASYISVQCNVHQN